MQFSNNPFQSFLILPFALNREKCLGVLGKGDTHDGVKKKNLNIPPLAVITAIFSVIFHGVLCSFQYFQQKVMAHF